MMDEETIKNILMDDYKDWKKNKYKYLLQKIDAFYSILTGDCLILERNKCKYCGEMHDEFTKNSIKKIEELIIK